MPDLDLTEKRFESDIEQSLLTYVGYQKGDPKAFDRALALDVGTLLAFVRDTPVSYTHLHALFVCAALGLSRSRGHERGGRLRCSF